MKLNLKSNDIESRFRFYSVVRGYYAGNLWHDVQRWNSAVGLLSDLEENRLSSDYCEGLSLLQFYDDSTIYEFNRLFVGPDKLLAPPYESAYLNPKGLLMQEETLAVRKFYQKMGLAVSNKNCEPDDYIGFELEFVCYLLHNSAKFLELNDLSNVEHHLSAYEDFFANHLVKWLPDHCRDIMEHSQNDVCTGMAKVMAGFIDLESSLFTKTSEEGI